MSDLKMNWSRINAVIVTQIENYFVCYALHVVTMGGSLRVWSFNRATLERMESQIVAGVDKVRKMEAEERRMQMKPATEIMDIMRAAHQDSKPDDGA